LERWEKARESKHAPNKETRGNRETQHEPTASAFRRLNGACKPLKLFEHNDEIPYPYIRCPMRQIVLFPILALFLVVGCYLKPDEDAAIAEIRRLGGKVEVDAKRPEGPRVTIKMLGPEFSDANLRRLKEINNVTHVRLDLAHITDAGLL